MISVLILTKNEERDLPGCLDSVGWSDDIHVYDSYSDDRTVEIAQKFGARITQRRFDDWCTHHNYGLKNIPFKYSWVFYLDADERVTPTLLDSLKAAVFDPGSFVAFQIERRDFFLGRWLKHVQSTPRYTRLFRPEKLHYERLVHGFPTVDGAIGFANGYLDHFPFSKGMKHWVERHNAYSTLEARQIMLNRSAVKSFSLSKALFAKEIAERREHQKEAFYRLPARPATKFLLLYFAKRGFLDGYPGFTYAMLQSFYEYMIVLKTRELINPDPSSIQGARVSEVAHK